MKLMWAVLCSSHSIDRDTNTISLFTVVEAMQIGISAGPGQATVPGSVLPLAVELVTLWRRDTPDVGEQGEIRAGLRWPGEAVRYIVPPPLNLEAYPRHRQIFSIPSVRAEGVLTSGVYQVEFVLESRHRGRWRLDATVPLELSLEVIPSTEVPEGDDGQA